MLKGIAVKRSVWVRWFWVEAASRNPRAFVTDDFGNLVRVDTGHWAGVLRP